MANINIVIPDAQLTRVLDGVAEDNGYNPATDGTKAAFAKKIVIDRIKAMVLAGERKKAEKDAQATLNQTALDIT